MDDWEVASQSEPQSNSVGGGYSHTVRRLLGRQTFESQSGIIIDQLGIPVEKEYSDTGLILTCGEVIPQNLGLVCCTVHPGGKDQHLLKQDKAVWCDFGGHWACPECSEQLHDGRGVCYVHAEKALQEYKDTFRQSFWKVVAEPFTRVFGEKITPKNPQHAPNSSKREPLRIQKPQIQQPPQQAGQESSDPYLFPPDPQTTIDAGGLLDEDDSQQQP